jgi:hypothetical protein
MTLKNKPVSSLEERNDSQISDLANLCHLVGPAHQHDWCSGPAINTGKSSTAA